jgi:hypothetical protein
MRTNLAYSISSAIRAAGALAMLASLTTGCQIYLGDDDPQQCTLPPPEPPLLLLDPVTGECVPYGVGPICDPDTCECAEPVYDFPSWAPCNSACTGLDELTCMATPGCRATYRLEDYNGCVATDQTGPIQGTCAGLDAWECSRHDDCVAVHDGGFYIAEDPVAPQPPPLGWFISCDSEPTPCDSNTDCRAGERCNAEEVCMLPPDCLADAACVPVCGGICVPDDRGSCFGEVVCLAPVPACEPGSVPAVSNGCYTGECIPLAECPSVPFEECHGQPACDALPPTCAEGEVPQIRNGCWTGACIPLQLCEPQPSPGACFGQITCDAAPPVCPDGAVPGIANGCFDGTCIRLEQCGAWPPSLTCTSDVLCESLPPYCPQGYVPLIDGTCWSDICAPAAMCGQEPVSCTDIVDEEACLSAPSCTPMYTGVNCTCGPDGACTCQSWQFDRCS